MFSSRLFLILHISCGGNGACGIIMLMNKFDSMLLTAVLWWSNFFGIVVIMSFIDLSVIQELPFIDLSVMPDLKFNARLCYE